MTTHDTRSQLLAEIAAKPEDDTIRLAFADWLDERGDQPDDALRAEFIRVQCALDQLSGCNPVCSQEEGHRDDCRYGDAGESLCRRADELLAAHPEWSQCRCPECDGRGKVLGESVYWYSRERESCPTCGGTGDLFLAPGVSGASLTPPPKSRTVTFARGFIDSITCTLAEAFTPDGTPTPWSVWVVLRTPAERLRLVDLGPHNRGGARGGRFHDRDVWDWSTAHVPLFLMDEMAAANQDNVTRMASSLELGWVEFATEAEARDALALAAGRLVRRHAYPERT